MNLPQWLKQGWKEAVLLAVVAAFLMELVINIFGATTVWHRLTALEHSVQELQHERELEELRMRNQFDELRQKAEQNAQQVEKVEERVEKKKDGGHK